MEVLKYKTQLENRHNSITSEGQCFKSESGNLKITQWNIRGYFNNLENSPIFIFEPNPVILFIIESLLKISDKIIIKG